MSLVLLTPGLLWAESTERTSVQFAGFAYLGDAKDLQKNYPFTLAINTRQKSGQMLLDQRLQQELDKTPPRHIILNTSLGRLDQGNAIAMAITLDHETVSVNTFDDGFQLIAELGTRVLFFDFNTMSIIGSYPIILEYIDYTPVKPSEEHKRAIIRGMYTGELSYAGSRPANILAELSTLLVDLRVKPKFNNHLQVTKVVIENQPAAALPLHLRQGNSANIYVAQMFSKYLSRNQQVSVLPYTKGHAIGNRMSARFANGSVYSLLLPETDYAIELRLQALKQKDYDKNAVGRSLLYGTAVQVKASEPLSGKTYMDVRFKKAISKVVPNSQQEIDHWPGYQDSLMVLFDSLTREITNPSRSWVKTHADGKSAYKQLVTFRKIVEQCK